MSTSQPSSSTAVEPIVIPLAEEQFSVVTRAVETGRVRISTSTTEREQVVDVPTMKEEVSVEHVTVGRIVDAVPPTRHEGDTLIIPVLEEVLVVEKRLMLREEIRITTHKHESRVPQKITLRKQEAKIERLPIQNGAAST